MKVGIIGGGSAGLCAAWLLDGNADVTLLEQSNRLGGHAHTVYVPINGSTVPVELGFEFFNQHMFPTFCRLLEQLQIPTISYPFTYSYRTDNNQIILPPIQGFSVFWSSFKPSNLKQLLLLAQLIHQSKPILEHKDGSISLQQLLQGYPDSFVHDFFLPLFCAGWGIDPEEFKTFAAYNIMSWIVKNKRMGLGTSYWSEIPGGMSSYIDALTKQLPHTSIKLHAKIQRIEKDSIYKVHMSDGTLLQFDHLIIATNAIQARKLIAGISQTQEVMAALESVDYLTAQLAIHTDERFMPLNKSDWSVANVWKQGRYSTLTTYKAHRSQHPLLRSWLLPGFPTPNSLIEQTEFYHAKPTPAYFKAQQLLAAQQGKNNLWFAGIYTHDIDSHESAISSAVNIVKQLAPLSERLKSILL